MFYLVDSKYIKETRGPKGIKRCFLFLIFFSENTGQIGTKLGGNVDWMVL
jgi:hypothetical protein